MASLQTDETAESLIVNAFGSLEVDWVVALQTDGIFESLIGVGLGSEVDRVAASHTDDRVVSLIDVGNARLRGDGVFVLRDEQVVEGRYTAC